MGDNFDITATLLYPLSFFAQSAFKDITYQYFSVAETIDG